MPSATRSRRTRPSAPRPRHTLRRGHMIALSVGFDSLLALPRAPSTWHTFLPWGGSQFHPNLSPGSYGVEWLHPKSGQYFQQASITVSAGDRDFVPSARSRRRLGFAPAKDRPAVKFHSPTQTLAHSSNFSRLFRERPVAGGSVHWPLPNVVKDVVAFVVFCFRHTRPLFQARVAHTIRTSETARHEIGASQPRASRRFTLMLQR